MVRVTDFSCYICQVNLTEYKVNLMPYYLGGASKVIDLCTNCLETGGFSRNSSALNSLNKPLNTGEGDEN